MNCGEQCLLSVFDLLCFFFFLWLIVSECVCLLLNLFMLGLPSLRICEASVLRRASLSKVNRSGVT